MGRMEVKSEKREAGSDLSPGGRHCSCTKGSRDGDMNQIVELT